MFHGEVLGRPLWLMRHSLCGSSQDAGATPGSGPGLGHVLSWKEQLFLIFPLLIHCDRLLQLSGLCAMSREVLPSHLEATGWRKVVQRPPWVVRCFCCQVS